MSDTGEVVWVDREGRAYSLSDITTSHLRNIIRMLKRQERAMWSYCPQGEYAADALNSDLDRISDQLFLFRHELEQRIQ